MTNHRTSIFSWIRSGISAVPEWLPVDLWKSHNPRMIALRVSLSDPSDADSQLDVMCGSRDELFHPEYYQLEEVDG